MADPSESPEFKNLLAAMPKIAEAVKAFPEAVQSQAFDAIMAELRTPATGAGTSKSHQAASKATRAAPAKKKAGTSAGAGSRAARARTSGPTLVKDLDLAPKGKKSLKAFAEEKKPRTQLEENVLSVYYLREVAGLPAVTIDHVFTCYKDMRWREPGDLANSLAVTSSRKRYLDTADLADIKLTPPGRNLIEHDLPAPKAK